MPEDLRVAVEALRRWMLLPASEIAVVVPVIRGTAGPVLLVGVGDARSVVTPPSRVLGLVLRAGADAFVLVHTHKTDSPPSPADAAVTRRLVAAAAVVGVRMLGHYVLAPTRTYDCFDDALAA